MQTHPSPAHADTASLVFIPGGTITMGSNDHHPEERPAYRVTVDGFWMDRHPMTNAQFAAFVGASGHVTTADLNALRAVLARPSLPEA